MEKLFNKVEQKLKNFRWSDLFMVLAIFFAGALSYGMARFVLLDKNETHYHANFALYINGQKEEFRNFTYYEEISACSKELENNPKSRVHMHDNVNDIIHIHDKAVTWSNFFENLGFTFGDNILVTQKDTYLNTASSKFTYILNGEKVDNIATKVIKSEDVLLISYGDETLSINEQRYNSISKNANEYNQKSDPSTCSGGGKENTRQRLIRTLFN